MDNRLIDDDTRRGHYAIAHDLSDVSDFFEFDLQASLLGCDSDQIGRGLAVPATRARYLDMLHFDPPGGLLSECIVTTIGFCSLNNRQRQTITPMGPATVVEPYILEAQMLELQVG